MPTDILSRRQFLKLAGLSAAGALTGCAANPVTGQQQFMLMSPSQEIDVDKKNAPHQFSTDYGTTSDTALNAYVSSTGAAMARHVHRPDMPYNFHCVDAVYVNAYAFPGGSIACTRGIMLTLENEAELSALLGHELGHVNARHTASRMSKGMVISALATGVAAYVGTRQKSYAALAAGLGGVASGALLAFYSREDERQADSLGMEYMVKSGYSPKGMVGLQQHLVDLHDKKPSALDMLFASHPMSEERRENAINEMDEFYANAKGLPLGRERFMDSTASLRARRKAIEALQDGEKHMGKKQFADAEKKFSQALKDMPDDYAGLLMMSKCQLALKHDAEAARYAKTAHEVKPAEPQALHMKGMASLGLGDSAGALRAFHDYERMLPGNANTVYLKGVCLESMGQRDAAAREYSRFLQSGGEGEFATHAYGRLQNWGYIRPKR
ncbi:putative Zn-dependent protease [Desulfobaculum xiamenense]|uniref:Putative Zn-dependent protease n=1 Tax=Desulfobaculum xiamenense TaxID=995050 RepID=A0A846QHR9_9BACT|nr:M48 family metalloprotease [Desulfobaculum xiamenense]NJB67808.1 putative Zn-dependent protease [Desulfobaculum xiamenense]